MSVIYGERVRLRAAVYKYNKFIDVRAMSVLRQEWEARKKEKQ